MTTGERIKAARKAANMTQQELAEKLEIPYQSISQWERDLRKPKFTSLSKLADALCISPVDLLGDEDRGLYLSGYTFAKEIANIQSKNHSSSALPKDLQAVKSIMLLSGYDLVFSSGTYYFVTQRGRYRLTEEQVANLLNSSVQYVEYLCLRLEKEFHEISRYQRSDTSSISPPRDYIDMLVERDETGTAETPPAPAQDPTEDK